MFTSKLYVQKNIYTVNLHYSNEKWKIGSPWLKATTADIMEFTLSTLEPEASSLFWLILPSMLHQTDQVHDQLI